MTRNRVVALATEHPPGSRAQPLPTSLQGYLILRATAPVWLRVGAADMGPVARDANSILFPGGERLLQVPPGASHFRVRADECRAYVQLEGVNAAPDPPQPEPEGMQWAPNNPTALPIVPGGAGWGMNTDACFGRDEADDGLARAWRHIAVTNLNSDGPGSLREALTAEGPRVVTFWVSGVIDLHDLDDDDRDIKVTSGDLYVAGETAPAPGIVVYGAQLLIQVTAKNTVFSHFANFQYPYQDKNKQDSRGDPVNHFVPEGETPQHSNIVHANMCYGWTNDEGGDAFRGCHDLTFYQTLFIEGLNNTDNLENDNHGFGPIVSCEKISTRANFARCGFIHNQARNPSTSAPLMSVANCLIYDCWQRGIELSSIDNHATKTNVEGNIFIDGPMGADDAIFIQDGGGGILNDSSTYYVAENRGLGYDDSSQGALVSNGPGTMVSSRIADAHPPGLVVTRIGDDREEFARLVARHVGPWPAHRQPVIQRVLDHLEARLTGTGDQGGELLYPEDIGGMPALDENTIDHTEGEDPMPGVTSSDEQTVGEAAREIQPSGYTAFEEWLDRKRAALMPADAVRID